MFRVCGVTFDHTTNYGSCFQAFALQTAIEKLSVEGGNTLYDLLPLSSFKDKQDVQMASSLVTKMKRAVLKILNRSRRRRFLEFEEKFMHYADCHSRKELMLLNDSYDAFVCGSDVIWNPDFTAGDSTYFLDFAEKYKFSYAASFGVFNVDNDYTYPSEKARALFEQHLHRLSAISVRERSAVAVVERFTSVTPDIVCDPVLLLDKSDWVPIADSSIIPKGRYIFAYSTYISPNFLTFLNRIEKQTGLRVIHVTWDSSEAIKRLLLRYPTPQEWLALLLHADYVVTNSFHATAFSVLLHKTFFTVMRDKAVKGTRVRLYDFLDSMNLRERMHGDTPETIDLTMPDFSFADAEIARIREQSNAYLRKNLEAAFKKKTEKEYT